MTTVAQPVKPILERMHVASLEKEFLTSLRRDSTQGALTTAVMELQQRAVERDGLPKQFHEALTALHSKSEGLGRKLERLESWTKTADGRMEAWVTDAEGKLHHLDHQLNQQPSQFKAEVEQLRAQLEAKAGASTDDLHRLKAQLEEKFSVAGTAFGTTESAFNVTEVAFRTVEEAIRQLKEDSKILRNDVLLATSAAPSAAAASAAAPALGGFATVAALHSATESVRTESSVNFVSFQS